MLKIGELWKPIPVSPGKADIDRILFLRRLHVPEQTGCKEGEQTDTARQAREYGPGQGIDAQ